MRLLLFLLFSRSFFCGSLGSTQTHCTVKQEVARMIEKNKETSLIHPCEFGDFDSDGLEEAFYRDSEQEGLPSRSLNWHIYFDNPDISTIQMKNFIVGKVNNEGDLDGDGGDELSIYTFNPYPKYGKDYCTSHLHILTFKDNKWVDLTPDLLLSVHEHNDSTVRKHPERSQYLIIESSLSDQPFTVQNVIHNNDTIYIQLEHVEKADSYWRLVPGN